MAELPLLYRVARRLTRDPHLAQDLVAEALLKAASAWRDFDGRHARAWLLKILRNEHLMHLRKQGVRPSETSLDEQCPDPAGDFDRQVLARLTDVQILDEIDRLPEHYREVVVLCDVEGLPHSEAATVLDIRLGTVGSRLNRARAILRNRLAKLADEGAMP